MQIKAILSDSMRLVDFPVTFDPSIAHVRVKFLWKIWRKFKWQRHYVLRDSVIPVNHKFNFTFLMISGRTI